MKMLFNQNNRQMDDSLSWKKYPHHHKWFDKLSVAESFGYTCGPCGVAPDRSDEYIVRPIYNLSGMGVGATIKHIQKGDTTQVPPGYFWCEILTGRHFSATFEYVDDEFFPYWKCLHCYEGFNRKEVLSEFYKWIRVKESPKLPRNFLELKDVGVINVEFKGNNPIEVHLRPTPDPLYSELIPIWKKDTQKTVDNYLEMGYSYYMSYDDADSFLNNPRVGFMVKE